jgi:hypothetical protein
MTRDSPRPIAIQEQPEGVGKRACACNHTVKIRWLLKTNDADGGTSPAMRESKWGVYTNKNGRVFRPGRFKL